MWEWYIAFHSRSTMGMILLPLAYTLYIYMGRDGTLPAQYRMGMGLLATPSCGMGMVPLTPLRENGIVARGVERETDGMGHSKTKYYAGQTEKRKQKMKRSDKWASNQLGPWS